MEQLKPNTTKTEDFIRFIIGLILAPFVILGLLFFSAYWLPIMLVAALIGVPLLLALGRHKVD